MYRSLINQLSIKSVKKYTKESVERSEQHCKLSLEL